MNWTKTGRTVCGNGESTVTYTADDPRYVIESRKWAIPHASRGGYWMHTTYWLIVDGEERKEYYTLADAKRAVEVEE